MIPLRPHLTHSKVALSIKATTIILATLTVYYQDLIVIGNEALQSEPVSHIFAIPFLLTYLIYRKRRMLRAVVSSETFTPLKKKAPFSELVGAMLCLAAFLLYWHGSYTFQPLEYHILSLPLFVAGLILLMFNAQTLRALAFPVAFLLFLIPSPLEIVYTLLKAIGLPVSLATQHGSLVLILEKSGALR